MSPPRRLGLRSGLAISAGIGASLLGLLPMFHIADARGYHYEEVLDRPLVAVVAVVLATVTVVCTVIAEVIGLTLFGESAPARAALLFALAGASISISLLGAGPATRHFWLFAIGIPGSAAATASLWFVDALEQRRHAAGS